MIGATNLGQEEAQQRPEAATELQPTRSEPHNEGDQGQGTEAHRSNNGNSSSDEDDSSSDEERIDPDWTPRTKKKKEKENKKKRARKRDKEEQRMMTMMAATLATALGSVPAFAQAAPTTRFKDTKDFPILIDKDSLKKPSLQDYDIYEQKIIVWTANLLPVSERDTDWIKDSSIQLTAKQAEADQELFTRIFVSLNRVLIKSLGDIKNINSGRTLLKKLKAECSPEGFFVDDAHKEALLNPTARNLGELADKYWQEWLEHKNKVTQAPLDEELETAFTTLTSHCKEEFRNALAQVKNSTDLKNLDNYELGLPRVSWFGDAAKLLELHIKRYKVMHASKTVQQQKTPDKDKRQGRGDDGKNDKGTLKGFMKAFGDPPKRGTKAYKSYVAALKQGQVRLQKQLNHVAGKGKGKGDANNNKGTKPCRFFNTPRGCKFGEACWDVHDRAQQVNNVTAQSPQPPAAPSAQPAQQPVQQQVHNATVPTFKFDKEQLQTIAAAVAQQMCSNS